MPGKKPQNFICVRLPVETLRHIASDAVKDRMPPAPTFTHLAEQAALQRKERLARGNQKSKAKAARNADIMKMKRAGKTHREIAEKHKISPTRVSKIVSDNRARSLP